MNQDLKECPERTSLTREQLSETKATMTKFFGTVVNMKCHEGGYPLWRDSVEQLMEVAWVMWKWEVLKDSDGKPMSLKAIASRFCRNLHVSLPQNISAVAHRSMRSTRQPVVDYYHDICSHTHLGLSSLLDASKPDNRPLTLGDYAEITFALQELNEQSCGDSTVAGDETRPCGTCSSDGRDEDDKRPARISVVTKPIGSEGVHSGGSHAAEACVEYSV